MATRHGVGTTLTVLALLVLLTGPACADLGDRGRPPCRSSECLELRDRVSRVDVELQFHYVAAGTNLPAEHHLGMIVTIPDQGIFHLREVAQQGLSAHLMWIHLVGADAEGAVHFEADEPSGTTRIGSCSAVPVPRCDAKVDLDLITSSPFPGPPGETDYALTPGRYTVRVIYADGSRKRMVINTDTY